MANLTLEKLVRPLGSPKPEPGHHIVVYKESGEGRVYYQTLASGEQFRPPMADRLFGSFVGYAVQSGMSLRHSFNDQLETGVGEKHDIFKLHVTLYYRVFDPAALVERLGDDPLGSLESEIRGVFRRQASDLGYEELIDSGFDIEGYLLSGREHLARSKGTDLLDRFRSFAQDLGLELDRVEVTRTYSAIKIGKGRDKVEADYNAGAEIAKVRGRQRVDAARVQGEIELEELSGQKRRLVAQTDRQIQMLDAVATEVNHVIANVAKETGTVPDLRRLVGELARAREEMGRMIGPSSAPEMTQARHLLGPGNGHGFLGSELHRMLEVVSGLEINPSERIGLIGRLLHVLAGVSLDEEEPERRLDDFIADLGRYCTEIDLARRLSDEEQNSYFRRFRSAESARTALADLAPRDYGKEEVFE